ncbi:60S ribosomal protein L21 [Salvia divinorum]|uniref:60S ribosomal protein L21 n=1 Tax=Salvia divinorum TaxID=28513 RepID=A0ABD1HQU5_SALDI
MAALSLSYSLVPKPSHNQTQTAISLSRPNLSFLSHSLSHLSITARKQPVVPKATDTEAAFSVTDAEIKSPVLVSEPAEPKREEVFAVVMVGGRQYIVFPGRYIYTQRLKGASVNDKVTLNKVLLVGTKTSAYIGKPIVPNATVEAVVEEQTLDKKVIVFKYKKKKNYRRNIGHRQPITRIRITSITGYQDSPVTTLD